MYKMLFKLEFSWGTLSKEKLQEHVANKVITASDYKEITGESYIDPNQQPTENTTTPTEPSQPAAPTN
ncbi:XkdX family protein [Bombilactobacillus bombi]|uniref:XkdX family protein n=1 Tax=Bombilactobacillus bombi TaxID=1303590 RepID=A0A417Z643_9LACO|nr:XkdX family protein [Bombilactobacillus bombi]RHW46072.1 XkdX family protein [Bombilactobacillus bombi]